MAEGGYDWYDDENNIPGDHDDDDADETRPFIPSSSSTPAPEFQTEQKEKIRFPDLPAVPSFSKEQTALPSLFSTTLKTAEGEIVKEFPNADKLKLKYKMDGKGRTEVGLISPKKPYYKLLTQIPGKSGEYRVNPHLPKEVLRALGESRRQTIETEIERLSEDIIENKKITEDTTKDETERRKAYERAQRQISSRIDLQTRLDYLKAGEYTRDGGGQSISFEVFQENEKKRQEREKQLRQEQEEREKKS